MELTLPDLGENIEEAEVLNVLVKKGDAVTKDQPVLELETDKATFELPSPHAGTVSDIHVKKGDTVRVGQKILTLEAGAAAREDGGGRKAKQSVPSSPEARDKRPRKKQTDEERAQEEDVRTEKERAGEEDESADEPRKAPATTRARKPETGEAKQREDAKPQELEDEKARAREDEKARAREEERADEPEDRARSSASREVEAAAGPATRRIARELGVDLMRLQGTGAGGRITPEDVKAFVRDRAAATRSEPAAAPSAPAASAPAADLERWGPVERRPLTGIEKTAARHLSGSWNEIPHVTHHDLADITELEESRHRYESGRKESEPKLTWTVLVVKAVAAGLLSFPRFNSSLDAAQEELVMKRYVHVGVAVDTEHGLLVPVIRDVDRKTTREIAAEITSLAERARARKLAREEMQGANFTVTNLGGIGGVAFTPIVSRPEVAILGVSRSREEVALRDGQVVRRVMLPLSLSYDHRVINGAAAARFVRYVADLLEDPLHLLMES
jgi:pyruvate dehydrogenase E2 component (dihydrolipoyllysine-residue acetyltransferase)